MHFRCISVPVLEHGGGRRTTERRRRPNGGVPVLGQRGCVETSSSAWRPAVRRGWQRARTSRAWWIWPAWRRPSFSAAPCVLRLREEWGSWGRREQHKGPLVPVGGSNRDERDPFVPVLGTNRDKRSFSAAPKVRAPKGPFVPVPSTNRDKRSSRN